MELKATPKRSCNPVEDPMMEISGSSTDPFSVGEKARIVLAGAGSTEKASDSSATKSSRVTGLTATPLAKEKTESPREKNVGGGQTPCKGPGMGPGGQFSSILFILLPSPKVSRDEAVATTTEWSNPRLGSEATSVFSASKITAVKMNLIMFKLGFQ